MRTIITSTGNTPESKFDARFGRAAWYCIYEDTTGDLNFIPNESSMDMQGAGIRAAGKVAELKVHRVISGDFGPKAKDHLDRSGIQMIILPDRDHTVGEIINKISK